MLGLEIVLIAIGVAFIIISFRVTETLSPKELEHLGQLSGEQLKKIIDNELKKATVDVDQRLDIIIDESMERVDDVLGRETNSKIMAISEFSDGVIDKINKNHEEVMFLYNMLNDKHVELSDFANQVQLIISENSYMADPDYIRSSFSGMQQTEIVHNEPPQNTASPEPFDDQPALDFLNPEPELDFHNTRPFTNFDTLDEEDLFDSKNIIEKHHAIEMPASEETSAPAAKVKAPVSLNPAPAPKVAAPQTSDAASNTDQPRLNHNEQILALYDEGNDVIEIAKQLKLGVGEVKLVVELYKGAH